MSDYEKVQQLAFEAMRTRDVAKRYASDEDKTIAFALNEAALAMLVGAIRKMVKPEEPGSVALAKVLLANIAEIAHEIGDTKVAAATDQLLASIDAARAPRPADE